eukprot:m.121127 g.121127  ORF g.121127 m.121127 type:complete len:204 (+) comp15630_c0_seq1:132-743(+)
MTLGQAAADGSVNSVLSFLSQGYSPNEPTQDGHYPLCLAAFWGHEGVVDALLEHGADINLQNRSNGWTALHAASLQGHAKIVFQLFDYTPRLDLVDHNGCTAADFASALDNVWPHFAAEGSSRTSKEYLIAKNIIYKVAKAPQPALDMAQPYFNRPGSAYVMNLGIGGKSSKLYCASNSSPTLQLACAGRPQFNEGDVLEEES